MNSCRWIISATWRVICAISLVCYNGGKREEDTHKSLSFFLFLPLLFPPPFSLPFFLPSLLLPLSHHPLLIPLLARLTSRRSYITSRPRGPYPKIEVLERVKRRIGMLEILDHPRPFRPSSTKTSSAVPLVARMSMVRTACWCLRPRARVGRGRAPWIPLGRGRLRDYFVEVHAGWTAKGG